MSAVVAPPVRPPGPPAASPAALRHDIACTADTCSSFVTVRIDLWIPGQPRWSRAVRQAGRGLTLSSQLNFIPLASPAALPCIGALGGIGGASHTGAAWPSLEKFKQ